VSYPDPLTDRLLTARNAALSRMSEAGANQTSCLRLVCELQRDRGRTATVDEFLRLRSEGVPGWPALTAGHDVPLGDSS
jgi:hypothetical protein